MSHCHVTSKISMKLLPRGSREWQEARVLKPVPGANKARTVKSKRYKNLTSTYAQLLDWPRRDMEKERGREIEVTEPCPQRGPLQKPSTEVLKIK